MEFSKGDYIISEYGKLLKFEYDDDIWHYAKGVSGCHNNNITYGSYIIRKGESLTLTPYEIKGVDFNIKFQIDKIKEIIDNRELDKNSKEFIILEVKDLVDYVSEKIKF